MDFLTDRLSEQYGSFPEAVIFLYAGQILYSNEAGQALLKKEDFPQDLLPALAEHPGGMEIALGKTFYFVTVSQLQEGDLLVLRDLDPPPEKKHPFSNAVYRMRECLSNLSATQWKMQQVLEDNGLLDGLEQDLANQNRLVFQMLRLTRQAELTQELNYKSFPREEGFDITVATEVMAVLCLAEDLTDLKARLARMIVGYNGHGQPVTAGDLKAAGAMAALLKDAIRPNLAQSLEGTPAIIHGGPFANIAHGCNSVAATKAALRLGDYVVTEAGFGADLGAEKFLDIKCRRAGLRPDAVVIVATVRALKLHGGADKTQLATEDTAALRRGLPNLLRHIENITQVYGLPAVVALNRFTSDTAAELALVQEACAVYGAEVALSEVWEKGSRGGMELAHGVLRALERENHFRFAYDAALPIRDKLLALTQRIYGGHNVAYTEEADREINRLTELGFGGLPVCVAKTQYSLSDDPTKLGAPQDFILTVRKVKVSAGAGFIVALTGDILTMPGLPKTPAAEAIDVDENGVISGLF